ncbi:disease resistance protein RPS2-like [Dioscorea cayenensis subsp. rotundata]|uniref:Disease resistance protein RPS2-like n=1 Tax=Dioscorea cayennensis subsp. rotundata TaxID=55577 RepID=A0AB40C4W8_DIOCR|nr:disease resistance protein RPS2-like [Dioscorea cayenensis subsp. rotundata]
MNRAQVLHEAFGRRKNFIIILDDIWERVSLQNVGIPEPDGSNVSKVVWTTSSMNVFNSMESEKEIKVGAEDVIMSTEIQPIAKQVAKECGRLPDKFPLLISRNYNWLSNDKIRAYFLYCALYPEDHQILVDVLIEYWMAEGLINEEGSIQTEKDKGHAYLKELKDACMIESIRDDDKYVRMHDLIRDLAINITREPPLFMVKVGLRLEESPKEEEWVESLQRVSLMRNDIKAFSGQPNCPQLSTLLLHHNGTKYSEITFSDTFFKHMHNLKVLDLSNTGIKSLPNLISVLVNLQALILTKC